jgi:hypothetical protein
LQAVDDVGDDGEQGHCPEGAAEAVDEFDGGGGVEGVADHRGAEDDGVHAADGDPGGAQFQA